MRFKIKEKSKMNLLQRCMRILTQNSETLSIHFTQRGIRFFTKQEDGSTLLCDFKAGWFSHFVWEANFLTEILQVTCYRDTFLESFQVLGDTEIEFMLEILNESEGALKVIKTREQTIVEA